ncbi:hypothetical protein G6F37_003593 [Rhizopus arrhizus]|nr:hypothetical protein G6F38_005220 [Rhizopus arrhizus]KAG1160863.1 hypothetical protein G6F37_003593 [Rhizopus arrhizus]
MSEENIIEADPVFEEEFRLAKELAPTYDLYAPDNGFRKIISRSITDTYRGKRSISSFTRLATAMLKDEKEAFIHLTVFNMFTNTLKSMDTRLEILREKNSSKPEDVEELRLRTEILTKMINSLVDSGAITTNDCKVHFSSQLLKDCNIIPNKVLFDRRLIRLNTAVLYKQHKFNLIREDSEGYASLINELTISSIDNQRDTKGKLTPTPLSKVPDFLKTISSHIGVFHLDPNRVLDIILDFFIKQLTVNYTFWTEVIKQSAWIQKLTFMDMEGTVCTGPSVILAQLIGFRFYNYHDEEVAPAPQELYLTIAILLKNGLISLNDIIPHLAPFNEQMDTLKSEYNAKMNKEITTNSGGKLAMYGALGEEGSTQKVKRATEDSTAIKDSEKKMYEANDVVELTKALFSVGDLKNAETMLSVYDKLIDMFPQLAYDIYRICRVVLQPAYETFVPEKTKQLYARFSQCAEQSQLKSAFITHEDYNPKIPSQIKLKRVLVTDALLDDTQDLKKMERYVFFYREWRDSLELCESFEHLTTRFMPLMRLAGYRTYLATDLIQTLILIIGGLLDRERELPGCRLHVTNMIREFLLPAISFSKGNPGTMASVWEILYRLSYQERYCLYGEWSTEFYKKNIETKLLKARVERAAKSVMRRVSKNDVRRCGRDLGKLGHSNPTIVFNVILDQVQSFDNLAPIMADACRYLGDFSYDVLGFILTDKWTGSQGAGKMKKEKEKDDGMPANWLRSLATFTGMLFKKQDIDATPLLRYLAYRLRYDDSVADLILLNEFVTKMGGIEILASACTNDQIIAAGCSDSLKSEAFLPISADNRRASRRVLGRLKESLRRNNVGFEILILLYRLEEACLSETGVPASDRCSKLDRVHQTQLQYFELLTSLFEPEEYATLIPSVEILVRDYALPVHVAMTFNRPKTQHAIRSNMETPIVEKEIWTPFRPVIDALPTMLDIPAIPNIFTSEFYFMFWQLSLYDIHCPINHYEAAIRRHMDMIRQCQDVRSSFYQSNRPSVVSKAERQAQASLDMLNEDLPRHQAHVEKVMTILKDSQSRWFPSSMQRQALISNVLQHCILPRSKISEVDAAFCYEFAMLMHKINTVNFSSLTLFDKVLSDSLPADFIAFSEYETTIHSRFIFKALSKMGDWHKDEKLYLKGAHGDGLIGFQKNWNADASQGVAKEDLLSFTEFQRVLYKWHFKSCLAIEQALKSGESHLIKNAFLVLRQFMPCFPAVVDHGNSIIKIVKRLSEEEKRGNIKVLARSYIGLVARYKNSWTTKNAFLGLKEPSPPAQPPAVASNSNATTPSATTETKTISKNEVKSSSSSQIENEKEEKKREMIEPNGRVSSSSSPSRRSERPSADSPSSTTERKRSREAEPRESDKAQRTDESGGRHRTTSGSLRDTKDDRSRSSRVAEESSSRPSESSSSRHYDDRSSRPSDTSNSRHNDERTSSSRLNEPTSNTRYSDDRNSSSRLNPPVGNSSSDPRASSSVRSSKRVLEDRERERSERPEKRSTARDIRDERGGRDDRDRLRRTDRLDDRRIDDRRMDDRRMDDRRMDDRRFDERRLHDRRDRDRDHRSSRRR